MATPPRGRDGNEVPFAVKLPELIMGTSIH